MKILILLNIVSSDSGGAEWSLLDVCRGLAEKGHELHCLYCKEGDLLPHYQQFCKTVVKASTYRIKGHTPSSSISFITSLLKALHTQFDLIYANYYSQTFFGGILARVKGIPLVCHLRSYPPQRRHFPAQIQMGLNSCTSLIAVSQAARSSYLKAGFNPHLIKVVYNGIDLERFVMRGDRDITRRALGIPADAFVVLYAGRITRPKNLEMLIAAFARLGLEPDQARLLITGATYSSSYSHVAGDMYQQELIDLCQTLGISDRVHWLGKRSDVPEIFRAADVSVLPSILPETFGRVIAESMACGTPAIGLRYGGIPEVLSGEFQHFQVETGDVTGLAQQLLALKDWQKQDPTLGQRCRTYVEQHFSKERMVEEVEQAMQEAIATGVKRFRSPSAAAVSFHPWYPDSLGI
ncbi:glycosyltransferase family 4 protein [Gloeocapsopsis dulcis]|uniref:Glycosyl transferase group 1 n=1 Tax=Gloeocapsopsis dulcis AAB1 = 1H9 TaxID=1433147 RepID=A0A6N8G1R8_9CHRO|nr:glycosyltransferase family 4 protein [Gloeocapsopsis dulcis]MUL38116.1 glycosyl transferase group 1 [Gloeocapsopsis dulcis AAB1 = 1H9]WNN89379.1 glycosyltransferase family 4 protein [Gloeocapsopsis dulcis]